MAAALDKGGGLRSWGYCASLSLDSSTAFWISPASRNCFSVTLLPGSWAVSLRARFT
ncbi:MAG: hypothetical protein RQ859_06225 [Pyrobaculum sp.]|nr:hypothetical protein [Pyrobaculum sp.]